MMGFQTIFPFNRRPAAKSLEAAFLIKIYELNKERPIMVIANKHIFHPRFTDAMSAEVPLCIEGMESLSDFWQPVSHPMHAVHPLTILNTYNKEVWRHARTKEDKPRQSAIQMLYQDRSLKGVMKGLDTLTATEESAFWYHNAENEWSTLQNRTEAYIERSSWRDTPKHVHAFRRSVALEYLRYKKAALALLAYRRAGELTRQAHYDCDFTQIKTIIRQWLQPAWLNNALGTPNSRASMDRIRRKGDFVSPMDYYSRLGGSSVLTDHCWPPLRGTKEDLFDQWFLNPGLENEDLDEILSKPTYRPDIGEQDTGFLPRVLHILFTRTFSSADAVKGKPDTSALWLVTPSAACLHMWLNLEQEFRSSITETLRKTEALLPSESWKYETSYMQDEHVEEPLQDKVELILRMASRFKHTRPENLQHCQTILGSEIYSSVLESLGIPSFSESSRDLHYRISVLRYGKGLPFFSDLPCTEGTYGWNGSLPEGLSTVSPMGAFRPPPPDAPYDETLAQELKWRIDAADIRIQAGLSTPDKELKLLLKAVGWGSKIHSGKSADPSFAAEHFMYYSILGDKNEVWYTKLHNACLNKWSLSEDEWDEAILSAVLNNSDYCPHITALTQYWLSDKKWSLFRYMQQENLNFDSCIGNTIHAFSRLYKIYPFNNIKFEETVLNFDNAPEKEINRLLSDKDSKYKQKVAEGLDFIRFNLILHGIQEINPILDNQYTIPDDEKSKLLLQYIFQNFEGALQHEKCQIKGFVYGEDLLRNVINRMSSAAEEMLTYDDVSANTHFDSTSF